MAVNIYGTRELRLDGRMVDDLWQEAITPKFKLDRIYKDNLEASHIK